MYVLTATFEDGRSQEWKFNTNMDLLRSVEWEDMTYNQRNEILNPPFKTRCGTAVYHLQEEKEPYWYVVLFRAGDDPKSFTWHMFDPESSGQATLRAKQMAEAGYASKVYTLGHIANCGLPTTFEGTYDAPGQVEDGKEIED